jgi:cell division protein FtsX
LSRYWRTTYDILVRHPSAVPEIERQYGLVEANHLSGTPGGISFEQYELIRGIPEVEVAAPIAMLGYLHRTPPLVGIRDPLPDGIYRVSATATIWDGYRSLVATFPEPYYAFYHQRLDQIPPWDEQIYKEYGEETVRLRLIASGWADWSGFIIRTPYFEDKALLAAVDPVQEARLIHLDQMVVQGDYLPDDAPPLLDRIGRPIVPLLLNAHNYVSETITVRLEQVEVFDGKSALLDELRAISGPEEIGAAPRQVVWEGTVSVPQEWRNVAPLLEIADGKVAADSSWAGDIAGYLYVPAPIQYRAMQDPPASLPAGRLVLEAAPLGTTPTDEQVREGMFPPDYMALLRTVMWKRSPELVFRKLEVELPQELVLKPYVQGVFEIDPLTVLGSASPNQVPLETYFPPLVTLRYDEAGQPVEPPATLRPTLNAGGYLVSPPDMLISLDTARHLLMEGCVEWVPVEGRASRAEHTECSAQEDIISAIRVRVGGISELTPQAQASIEDVAQRIVELTGLHVDIMVGSSPQPVLVHLPGYGEVPGLGYVEEGWVKKGVVTLVTRGVNRADAFLFSVMLVACLLFLFNANYVSVLGRLPEFGVMRALGWRRRTLFGMVLGEALVLGLFSGLLGALLALGIGRVFTLPTPLVPIVLLAPLGGSLFVLGALLPAWWAAHAAAAPVINTGEVAAIKRVPGGSNLLGYAVGSTLRRPARTLAGLAGLALAAGLLVLLRLAMEGLNSTLYGTMFGMWIRTQIRPYHFMMGAVMLLAAALGVAELMILNITQRRREIGILAALGWRRRDLFRVFLAESGLIGLTGGLLGTALAVLLYRLAYGSLPDTVATWLQVAGLGIALPLLMAMLATLYPAHRGARLLPLDALRGQERLAPTGAPSRTMIWLGVAGVLAAALVIAILWTLNGQPASTLPSTTDIASLLPATSSPMPPPTAILTPTPVGMADLPRYRLELVVDVEGRRLEGQERIEFTNRTGNPLDVLALRLYSNSPRRTPEGTLQEMPLQVEDVRWNGQPVRVTLVASDTAALLSLDNPLPPGEQATVDLAFELQVSHSASLPSEVWTLGTFFPMLAVHEASGWRLDVCEFCPDIVYSESSFYEYTVTAPADWEIAATGGEVDIRENRDGTLTHVYEAGPVRDLALVLSPELHVQSRKAAGIVVSVYSLPDDPQAGEILTIATEAFNLFNERFGPYPYSSLRLAVFSGPGMTGWEYPGLIYLHYRQGDSLLDLFVAHEIAHQWWYGVVGNDVFTEPWLDEALAEYSAVLYLEEMEGAGAVQPRLQAYEDELIRLHVLRGETRLVGSAVWEFAPKGEHYFDIVYGKGALFMNALRQKIGDEAFFAGWRTYYDWYKFGMSTGRGFLEAMQQAAGQDLRPFFEEWIGPLPPGEH